MRAVYIIWYRELLRFFRERTRIISALAMPLLFLVFFGAGFSHALGNLASGVDFVTFLFPGIIAMSVLMTSFMSGMSVVWDREFGFLKEVLVTPLSRSGVALGKALGGATVATAQGALLLLFAPIIGIALNPLLIAKLLPLMLLLSVTIASLGILIASRMKSVQAFQMAMTVLVFPMIFLSGAFFPVNQVPMWLKTIIKLNPATYGVDALRQLFLPPQGDTSALGLSLFGQNLGLGGDIAIVALFGALTISLSALSFRGQG
ncbi:MAG: ABC transporter permease [Chloroflexota bacterium]